MTKLHRRNKRNRLKRTNAARFLQHAAYPHKKKHTCMSRNVGRHGTKETRQVKGKMLLQAQISTKSFSTTLNTCEIGAMSISSVQVTAHVITTGSMLDVGKMIRWQLWKNCSRPMRNDPIECADCEGTWQLPLRGKNVVVVV